MLKEWLSVSTQQGRTKVTQIRTYQELTDLCQGGMDADVRVFMRGYINVCNRFHPKEQDCNRGQGTVVCKAERTKTCHKILPQTLQTTLASVEPGRRVSCAQMITPHKMTASKHLLAGTFTKYRKAERGDPCSPEERCHGPLYNLWLQS